MVTCGALVQKVSEASRQLAAEGVSVEIVDIRTINPLDTETILESVKKTSKVLVAHEDTRFQGFGGEVAAHIAEFAFEYLDGPVRRLGGSDTPVPFSAVMEEVALPQAAGIKKAILDLAAY